nr:unnamed protein product [Callosobruchus analis]
MWKNRAFTLVQHSKTIHVNARRTLQQATTVEMKDSKKSNNLLDTNVYLSVRKPSAVQAIHGSQTVSYDEIPGPMTLRVVAKFWEVIPSVGTEMTLSILHSLMSGSFGANSKNVLKKFFDHYGPVVKLHGAMGRDVVLLSRPEHAKVILEQENELFRSCMDSLEKYCKEFRICNHSEPFLINGPDWDMIIKSVGEPAEATVFRHQRGVEEICDDFIQRILMVRNTQEETPNDFRTEIFKWSLECLSSVTLNKNLGFLDPEGVNSLTDGGRLLTSLSAAMEALRKCENGLHLWKFLETPSWKSLVSNCNDVDEVLVKYVDGAIANIRERKLKNADFKEVPIIEYMLLKGGLLQEDVMTVLLDMFLVGANATTHTVYQLLYHLSKNTRCQIKLHEEISKYSIDTDMRKLPYLQACIKECLRIDPPVSIVNRVLSKDAVVHHYRIPKGTPVLFATHLNNFREEYFEDAHKFKPERWVCNDLSCLGNEYQEYATIPLGYGPKFCLGKDMADMEVGMLMYQICKRFKVEYNYGDIKGSKDLFTSSSKPLKFRFVERQY